MFTFGKKTAVIQGFADELVAQLVARFPAEKTKELGTKKAKPARIFGKAVGELEHRFAAFVAEHKLGIYGKAKLLNRIKWQMQEGGYPAEFIDITLAELTRAGVKRVAGSPASGTPRR